MLKSFSVIIILLFSFWHCEAQENLPSILWSQDYKLQWKDFKGQPQQNTDAVAITASGITFGYSVTKSETKIVDANFTIESYFYPEHSWYIIQRIDANVLNHERFHFNITELYARKFRKRISETTFTLNIREEADAIYKKINKELEAMQNEYDNMTNYSINIEKQLEWQKIISDQLLKFSEYK
jgi:hypothetical protein